MIASTNIAGDPDTWPEAVVYVSAIVALCFCFYLYARYWDHNDG